MNMSRRGEVNQKYRRKMSIAAIVKRWGHCLEFGRGVLSLLSPVPENNYSYGRPRSIDSSTSSINSSTSDYRATCKLEWQWI